MKPEEIRKALDDLFPDAHCELEHRNNYEMAVAVVLSAQTTDASVNRVTPELFRRYPDVYALSNGKLSEIEHCIASLGLYRNKAKSIQGMGSRPISWMTTIALNMIILWNISTPTEVLQIWDRRTNQRSRSITVTLKHVQVAKEQDVKLSYVIIVMERE